MASTKEIYVINMSPWKMGYARRRETGQARGLGADLLELSRGIER